MFIWAGMFIDGSQVFVSQHVVVALIFVSMAPKAKNIKPEDEVLGSHQPTAPGNATIWKDMLELAIQYIRDLPQRSDWDCPEALKVRDDTFDEVGDLMAPFNNNRLHPGTQHIVTVHLCHSISTLRPQLLSNTRGCLEPSSNRCRNQRRHPDSGRLSHAKSCSSNWGDRLHIRSSAVARRDPHRQSVQPCPQAQTWRDV